MEEEQKGQTQVIYLDVLGSQSDLFRPYECKTEAKRARQGIHLLWRGNHLSAV